MTTPTECRSCGGCCCTWGAASPIGTDQSAPYSASWNAPKSGTFTFLAQVTDDDGSDVSDPVTISVQKAKKKKKKRKGSAAMDGRHDRYHPGRLRLNRAGELQRSLPAGSVDPERS